MEPRARHLDLDDSEVVAITRAPGLLRIELRQYRADVWRNFLVRAAGQISEHISYFIGAGVTATHPSPETPLDLVEYAESGFGYLELGGHLKSEPWFLADRVQQNRDHGIGARWFAT